jgi:hypothetical protein
VLRRKEFFFFFLGLKRIVVIENRNMASKHVNCPKIQTIIMEDLPMATYMYFTPEKKVNSESHDVIANPDEPLTYYTAKTTDKSLICDANNGTLIIVLPSNIRPGSVINFERQDHNKNHMVTVQAESGNIHNSEHVKILPKSSGGSNEGSTLKLAKNSKAAGTNNDWTIVG